MDKELSPLEPQPHFILNVQVLAEFSMWNTDCEKQIPHPKPSTFSRVLGNLQLLQGPMEFSTKEFAHIFSPEVFFVVDACFVLLL